MKQRLFIAALLVAGLIAAFLAFSRQPAAPSDVTAPRVPISDNAPRDEEDASTGEVTGWVAPSLGERTLRAIADGSTATAKFVLGIAGNHPVMQAEGTEIGLPEFDAAAVRFEARVTSMDGTRAFWGTLEPDATTVELGPVAKASIRVATAAGSPMEGASVRLARSSVALVLETVRTDETGVAVFESLPPGRYHISIEAPGIVATTRVVDVPSSGLSTTIITDVGAYVSGSVTADGRPVSAARVLVYVDRAALGSAHRVVPEAVAETDGQGAWEATSLPTGPTSVMVIADGWAPKRSPVVDTAELLEAARFDIRLARGLSANVFVVDARGRPVADAAVTWSDADTGAGATRRADSQGNLELTGLPAVATLQATFADWSSASVQLSAVPDAERVELRLERFDASKIWRIRLRPPVDTEVFALDATDDQGRRCVSESLGNLDFVARGCGPGTLHLAARTTLGTAVVSTPATDGVEVALGEPTAVQLEIRGAAGEDWTSTTLVLTDEKDALLDLDMRPSGERSVVARTAVYPGEWTLLVNNERVGTRDFVFRVGDRPVSESFALQDRARIRAWAVDRYDAPVTGAWAMLFQKDQLVDVARTAGQLPAEFTVKAPWSGDVLIVDPRRGEGALAVKVDTEEKFEQRIQLSAPVQSLKIPATRPDTNEVESRLGARLVRDGDSLVLDFDRTGAPGAAAGLQRGDRLVTAWPVEDAMRVVVFRDGAGYVDATVR